MPILRNATRAERCSAKMVWMSIPGKIFGFFIDSKVFQRNTISPSSILGYFTECSG